jgi:hypothetical protein
MAATTRQSEWRSQGRLWGVIRPTPAKLRQLTILGREDRIFRSGCQTATLLGLRILFRVSDTEI